VKAHRQSFPIPKVGPLVHIPISTAPAVDPAMIDRSGFGPFLTGWDSSCAGAIFAGTGLAVCDVINLPSAERSWRTEKRTLELLDRNCDGLAWRCDVMETLVIVGLCSLYLGLLLHVIRLAHRTTFSSSHRWSNTCELDDKPHGSYTNSTFCNGG
jgi:hypothetical protein